MTTRPPNILRFMIWGFAPGGMRRSALETFDEAYGETYDQFGKSAALAWALAQALRAPYYGLVAFLMKYFGL